MRNIGCAKVRNRTSLFIKAIIMVVIYCQTCFIYRKTLENILIYSDKLILLIVLFDTLKSPLLSINTNKVNVKKNGASFSGHSALNELYFIQQD